MPEQTAPPRLEIFGLTGIPEVKPGDPLGALIAESAERQGTPLRDGDALVVTQKIVSKSEGRVVDLRDVDALAIRS